MIEKSGRFQQTIQWAEYAVHLPVYNIFIKQIRKLSSELQVIKEQINIVVNLTYRLTIRFCPIIIYQFESHQVPLRTTDHFCPNTKLHLKKTYLTR